MFVLHILILLGTPVSDSHLSASGHTFLRHRDDHSTGNRPRRTHDHGTSTHAHHKYVDTTSGTTMAVRPYYAGGTCRSGPKGKTDAGAPGLPPFHFRPPPARIPSLDAQLTATAIDKDAGSYGRWPCYPT